MESKIVLFGATGLVGAYTAIALKSKHYDVVPVGRRANDNGFFADNDMEYISADIKRKDSFLNLPYSDVYAILHFAGAMPAHMEGYDPYDYLNTNIIGTLNVLEYARISHTKKIIFCQSVSDVLHLGGTLQPIRSDSEMRHPMKGDHAVYSISKNTAVELIRHYEAAFGITAYILRLPTIYAYHPNPYYYVNGKKEVLGYRLLIKKAEKGEPIEIWGNPNNQKEIVYVDDFINLCECCLKDKNDKGGIFNVGNDFPLSFEEQINLIVEIFAQNGNYSKISYRPDMPSSPQFILDISNARMELEYCPEYDCRKAFEAFKKERELQRFRKLWGKEADYD